MNVFNFVCHAVFLFFKGDKGRSGIRIAWAVLISAASVHMGNFVMMMIDLFKNAFRPNITSSILCSSRLFKHVRVYVVVVKRRGEI